MFLGGAAITVFNIYPQLKTLYKPFKHSDIREYVGLVLFGEFFYYTSNTLAC